MADRLYRIRCGIFCRKLQAIKGRHPRFWRSWCVRRLSSTNLGFAEVMVAVAHSFAGNCRAGGPVTEKGRAEDTGDGIAAHKKGTGQNGEKGQCPGG